MAESVLPYSRILIVGANGQIGSSLAAQIPASQRIDMTRNDLDLGKVNQTKNRRDFTHFNKT